MKARSTALHSLGLLSLILTLLIGCDSQPASHQQQILALGTLVDVVIYGEDEIKAQQAVQTVREQLEKMHHDWHAWQPSKLTHINTELAQGHSIPLDNEGVRLISQSMQLAQQSEQLFNPATGQLIETWGFHSDERSNTPPPSDEQIQQLTQLTPSMANLTLKGNQLSSNNPAVQLDVGGFAKGYAVDLSIKALRSIGINNAIVNAGGDLRAIGNKNGIPWRIGIRHPRQPGVLASVDVERDESVFTSGDYERYFDYQGQRYHHIIDPRTGKPAEGTSSVTVIHTDATTADAAATALLIAGPTQWLAIAKKMGITQVMLVSTASQIYMTPAMAQRTTLMESPAKPVIVLSLP